MTQQAIDQVRSETERRFNKGSERMDRLELLIEEKHRQGALALAENTKLTQDLVETFESVKAGFKVLGHIGVVAKWLAAVVGAVAAVMAAIHGHKTP